MHILIRTIIFSLGVHGIPTLSGKYHSDVERGYGSGYGDPHFMVHTAGQEPICFDYNPTNVSELVLVLDPVSNLVVTALTRHQVHQTRMRTFMNKIIIRSPEAVQIEIDAENSIQLSGRDTSAIDQLDNGFIKFGDVSFTEIWEKNRTIHHVSIAIDNGPSFIVKVKTIRNVLSFGVTDIVGLSEKVCNRYATVNYYNRVLYTNVVI